MEERESERECSICRAVKALTSANFQVKNGWFMGRCRACEAAYARGMRAAPGLRGQSIASIKETPEVLAIATERFEICRGVLVSRIDAQQQKKGQVVGTLKKDGYRAVSINGTIFYAHRIAFAISNGRWPGLGECVDHIDHLTRNTNPLKLRAVTPAANSSNVYRARSTSKSGLLGVSGSGSVWDAFVQVDYAQHRIGYFETKQEAGIAVAKAKLRMQNIPLVTAAKIALIALGQEPDDGRSDCELIATAAGALELERKEA